jgi:membrane-bound lytic murein transglycosylase D
MLHSQSSDKQEMLDEIDRALLELKTQSIPFYEQTKTVPQTSKKELPDIHFEFKIEELNRTTPLDLRFNTVVKEYIKLFSVDRHEMFEQIMSKSMHYFPLFEEYLDRHDIPLELKYLPIIESALDPFAVSNSGAVGLWQFKYGSARLFDLKIDSYIDERRDPYKSTDAACRYLKYLHNTFNDWLLVLAAYNGGPGEVRKAIARSGGKTDFYKIRAWLPEQTQNYVPAFVSAVYLMNFPEEHQLYPQKKASDLPLILTDTLKIRYELSFEQISKIIPLTVEELRTLNPQYKKDYIPQLNEPLPLVLPVQYIPEYIKSENKIYTAEKTHVDYFSAQEEAAQTNGKKKIIHEVKKGEYFHKIALEYNCSIENIMYWNKLDTTICYPGQKLIIWVKE